MRRLLRLYPRSWRRRYGREMEALVAQTPATPRAVLDLLRGALDAHLHGEWCGRPAAGRRSGRWATWTITFAAVYFGAGFLALRAGLPGPLAALAGTASTVLVGTTAWLLRRVQRRRRPPGQGPDDPGQGAPVPARPLPDAPPALAAASRGSGRRSDRE
ncbi:MAG: hypothetical protein M3Z97_11700 [Candidatus Dormibacteraeota bacterium]|nr:hypothetical protein [Candidatus Dormibacteraeota bacterium]